MMRKGFHHGFQKKFQSSNKQQDVVLTEEKEDAIINLYNEEKLAHDVYTTLYEEYKDTDYGYIFEKIAESEERHMSAVEKIADKYDVDLPELEFGEFSVEEFQNLYEELVEQGLTSFEDAIAVGMIIENTDIEDIANDKVIFADDTQTLFVLDNLSNASYNHYNAFETVEDLII